MKNKLAILSMLWRSALISALIALVVHGIHYQKTVNQVTHIITGTDGTSKLQLKYHTGNAEMKRLLIANLRTRKHL